MNDWETFYLVQFKEQIFVWTYDTLVAAENGQKPHIFMNYTYRAVNCLTVLLGFYYIRARYTNRSIDTLIRNEFEWTVAMVRNILRNPTYKGAVVSQKRPTISLKSKKRKGVATAETFVVENMHEPIIAPERWELIQRLITSRKKCDKGDKLKYDNIFSGLVKCADCGYALIPYRSSRLQKPDVRENYDYYCRIHRENSRNCSKHRISAADLYNAVLEDIRRLAEQAVKNDEKMISSIATRLDKAEKDTVRQAEREIKKGRKRLAELDAMFVKTYKNTQMARFLTATTTRL